MNRLIITAAMLTALIGYGARTQDYGFSVDKTVCVSMAGDDTYEGADIGSVDHPYGTIGAAHAAVKSFLEAEGGRTALIALGEGTFPLSEQLVLAAGEKITGEGAEKTTIDLSLLTAPTGVDKGCVVMDYDDNLLGALRVSGKTLPGSQIRMSKGLLDNVHSINSRYSGGGSGNNAQGLGLYISGGIAQSCVVSNHYSNSMQVHGFGVYVAGGTLEDSTIAGNRFYDGRSRGHGICLTSGVVRRCKIYDNGKGSLVASDMGNGVYLSGGTLENCLVYDNAGLDATAGAVRNEGGEVRYCTIYGNKLGLRQSGAGSVAINNIIFGNEDKGATVSAGTFAHNLLDGSVPAGYEANNWITDNPMFVDAVNGDFHIGNGLSPAVARGAEPLAEVPDDFDRVVRSETKPTIGAYEYSQIVPFSVQISIPRSRWGFGDTVVLEDLQVNGVTDISKLSVTWYVDNVIVPGVGCVKPTFSGLAVGLHSFRVEAVYEGQEDTDEAPDAVKVLPTTTYVGNGTATEPFDTEEKATPSLADALASVWQDNGATTIVRVAKGTYALSGAVTLDKPVRIIGAGADQTTLVGSSLGSRQITLNAVGAELRGVWLTGASRCGGIEIKKGVVEGCCISNCVLTTGSAHGMNGVGVQITGAGSLLNSTVVNCHAAEQNCRGGGVSIENGSAVVSNCCISGCYTGFARAPSSGVYGGGVYAKAGTVWNSLVVGNTLGSNSPGGVAVYCEASDTKNPPTFLNCLIADNAASSSSAIVANAALFGNCTVVSNGTGTVRLTNAASTLINTILWGSGEISAEDGVTFDHCCYPTAEEGISGNTRKDPKLKGARHLYAIWPSSSCCRAGNPDVSWATAGSTDLVGRPRVTNGKIDIGCHEIPVRGLIITLW